MVRFAHYMGIVHPSLIRCASVGVNILGEKFGPRDGAMYTLAVPLKLV